jgi:hypothetical protein
MNEKKPSHKSAPYRLILMKTLQTATQGGHAPPATVEEKKREHMTQYWTWGYGARIRRKGLNLDLGNIFRIMVLQPDRIQELIKKISDCLALLKDSQPPPLK